MREFWKSTYISSAKPSHGHLVILLSHMVLPALFSTFELRSGLVRLPASNLWCLGFKHISFSMMQTFLLIFPSLFQIANRLFFNEYWYAPCVDASSTPGSLSLRSRCQPPSDTNKEIVEVGNHCCRACSKRLLFQRCFEL